MGYSKFREAINTKEYGMRQLKSIQFSNSILCLLAVLLLLTTLFAEYESQNVNLIGRWPYGDCRSVVSDGTLSFIGNGTVIEIIDISDPTNPVKVGEHVTESIIAYLQVAGDYVYVANWSDGFRIIDVSNPSAPFEAAAINFEGQSWCVSVFNSYAYVGNGTDGLLPIRQIRSLYQPTFRAPISM